MENIPVALRPANGFAIGYSSGGNIKDALLVSPSGKLRWLTPGTGHTGFMSLVPLRGQWLEVNRDIGEDTAGQFRIFSGLVMPTAGVYDRDWVVFAQNVTEVAGYRFMGWRRLTTGAGHVPGVDWQEQWVPTRPKQSAAVADLPPGATLEQIAAKINAILATDRTSTLRAA